MPANATKSRRMQRQASIVPTLHYLHNRRILGARKLLGCLMVSPHVNPTIHPTRSTGHGYGYRVNGSTTSQLTAFDSIKDRWEHNDE